MDEEKDKGSLCASTWPAATFTARMGLLDHGREELDIVNITVYNAASPEGWHPVVLAKGAVVYGHTSGQLLPEDGVRDARGRELGLMTDHGMFDIALRATLCQHRLAVVSTLPCGRLMRRRSGLGALHMMSCSRFDPRRPHRTQPWWHPPEAKTKLTLQI